MGRPPSPETMATNHLTLMIRRGSAPLVAMIYCLLTMKCGLTCEESKKKVQLAEATGMMLMALLECLLDRSRRGDGLSSVWRSIISCLASILPDVVYNLRTCTGRFCTAYLTTDLENSHLSLISTGTSLSHARSKTGRPHTTKPTHTPRIG